MEYYHNNTSKLNNSFVEIFFTCWRFNFGGVNSMARDKTLTLIFHFTCHFLLLWHKNIIKWKCNFQNSITFNMLLNETIILACYIPICLNEVENNIYYGFILIYSQKSYLFRFCKLARQFLWLISILYQTIAKD